MKSIAFLIFCSIVLGGFSMANPDALAQSLSCELDENKNCISQDVLSPLKQYKNGNSMGEIFCNNSYLVIKQSTGIPACVVNDTKLIERGWAVTLDHYIKNGPDFEIILDQGPCFGFCPTYTVTLTNDGTLVFEGIENLESIGVETDTIPSRDIANLISYIDEIDYFSLENPDDGGITDVPRTITTVTIGDKTNTITNIHTELGGDPHVAKLESMINGLANAQNRIDGTVPNVDDLNKTNISTLYVDSKLVDCVGVSPQQCMLVKDNVDAEWEMFYDGIDGFDYQEGTSYQISVDITEIENPPADGSSLKYTLIEILEPANNNVSLIDANNQFAFDFYSHVSQESDENIFFSPWSISTAFAIAFEGAKGHTADEIKQIFGFPHNYEKRTNEFKSAMDSLNQNDSKYQLLFANAMWLAEKFQPHEEYVDAVTNFYDGEISTVDFISNDGVDQINAWVEDKTQEKIKDILEDDSTDEDTRLAITNAIYFKGNWVTQFSEDHTEDYSFWNGEIGNTVSLMHLDPTSFNYTQTEELQILKMPYDGDRLSMLVLLPNENNGLNKMEESLSLENLNSWQERLRLQKVEVFMPKFKMETTYDLKPLLIEMGMPIPFSEGMADFSGLAPINLFISQAVHKAFVDVNEEGTEAAAATAIVVSTESSSKPQFPVFRADHPFVFLIQDDSTGNILFIGRMINP